MITKANYYYDKPTTDIIRTTLLTMRDHELGLHLGCIAMPKRACGLDGMVWKEISSPIEQAIKISGITIDVYRNQYTITRGGAQNY